MFECRSCGQKFSVPEAALKKYPGWVPKACMKCRDASSSSSKGRGKGRGSGANRGPRRGGGRSASGGRELLSPEQVLQRHHGGPKSGLFTDGSASPNPGPGGWGAVYVLNDEIIAERHGSEAHTTNNRMELVALLEGIVLVPEGRSTQVWSDSQLAIKTVTEWAKGWEARGWRRKGGPIKNLDLVRELYALAQSRPELSFKWIGAHSGYRWNEYADALATSHLRS